MIALHQARRHDAHHTLVPPRSAQHEKRRQHFQALHLSDGLFEDQSLHILTFAVQLVQSRSDGRPFILVVGEQQAQRRRRVAQAAGGIEARRDAEGDRSGIDGTTAPRDLAEGPQSRPRPDGEKLQPLSHIQAVLAPEWGQIGYGPYGHQIEEGFERLGDGVRGRGRQAYVKGMKDLEGQAHATQVVVGISPPHLVYEGAVRQLCSRLMVVDDDHIQAQVPSQSNLVGVVDPAVHGHEKGESSGGDALDGSSRESESFSEAAGQIRLCVHAEGTESQDHQCRCCDTICIVVAVYDYPVALFDRHRQPIDHTLHVCEQERVGYRDRALEKGSSLRRVDETPPGKDGGHRERQGQIPSQPLRGRPGVGSHLPGDILRFSHVVNYSSRPGWVRRPPPRTDVTSARPSAVTHIARRWSIVRDDQSG